MHNKIDLVEAASALDTSEDGASSEGGPSSGDDASQPAASAAADSAAGDTASPSASGTEAQPAASWAVRQLQRHSPASASAQQSYKPAAAPQQQQQQEAGQPSRVYVSAATGAGLGLLLQAIDRKVCLQAEPTKPDCEVGCCSGCPPFFCQCQNRWCLRCLFDVRVKGHHDVHRSASAPA